jgi:hypothetical protein
MLHHDAARVAREAPRRFRGNVRAVIQNALARVIRIRENGSIHVNDHLVSLARRPGIDAAIESRLCDKGQRVGPLVLHARRFRANVLRDEAGFASRVESASWSRRC